MALPSHSKRSARSTAELVLGSFCDARAADSRRDARGRIHVDAYDRRVRGAAYTLPYEVEREVEDLDALISEAGGAPFVFGHSSGAVLALEAAARQVSMSRLAVYEPPYIVDDTRTRPQGLGERVSALIDAGCSSEAIKLFLTEGPEVPPQAIDDEASHAGPYGSLGTHCTWTRDLAATKSCPHRLANINVPTLPQWGARPRGRIASTLLPRDPITSTPLAGKTRGGADAPCGSTRAVVLN